jgi:hypothetical protein
MELKASAASATECRAKAAEHHRLAGMCRSPYSRERHFQLERDFLALAEAWNVQALLAVSGVIENHKSTPRRRRGNEMALSSLEASK